VRRLPLLVAVVALLLVSLSAMTDSAVLDLGVLAGAGLVVAGGMAVIAYLRRGRR
jgi:hypothetical protein